MTEFSDEELISGLLHNDRICVEKIYKDNFSLIRSYVINNNGDNEEAKDVFQEALILLFEKAKNTDFQLSSRLGTYLYAVSRNIWLKRLSRNRRKEVSTADFLEENDGLADEGNEIAAEKNRQFAIMEEAMDRLGEPCKTLLESFYVQKMDMKAITEMFGYTNADNAKTQKYKCLMRLKKMFFDRYSR
ncbi:MAG: sigma-70 family RNA polymerase sigma factor [Chitinophagaceae bacterium]